MHSVDVKYVAWFSDVLQVRWSIRYVRISAKNILRRCKRSKKKKKKSFNRKNCWRKELLKNRNTLRKTGYVVSARLLTSIANV